jgi:hypothetical protein
MARNSRRMIVKIDEQVFHFCKPKTLNSWKFWKEAPSLPTLNPNTLPYTIRAIILKIIFNKC